MKRDIRELFKNEEFPKKKLPNFHEEEFLGKLEKLNKKEKSKPFVQIFKIAASIVLMLSVGYYFLSTESAVKQEDQPTLFVQVKQIEKEYLKNIREEWNDFLALTTDRNLIEKYKEKLLKLDTNYGKVSKQFEEKPNNINILESLINNLQLRLELLKDIKEHLKELNQKNTSNETIYL